MEIRFLAIPTAVANALWQDGSDAYGNRPERVISTSSGNPCRHCLKFIPAGAEMLVLAHSPFDTKQPYAETGPIFLCANPCKRFDPDNGVPEIFDGQAILIRAYDESERIIYGTGAITRAEHLIEKCARRLARDDVSFVHIRSSTNNCFQARVERVE